MGLGMLGPVRFRPELPSRVMGWVAERDKQAFVALEGNEIRNGSGFYLIFSVLWRGWQDLNPWLLGFLRIFILIFSRHEVPSPGRYRLEIPGSGHL